MSIKKKKIFLWIIAVFITIAAVIFQRKTGPTYPTKTRIKIGETEYQLSLIRSYGGEKYEDCEIKIDIPDPNITGKVFYRRYPTNDAWESINMEREERQIKSFVENSIFKKYSENILVAGLPYQPPAGKLEYYVELLYNEQSFYVAKELPVIVRFKGDVPAIILLPHVLLMFAAMLISTLAGLFAGWEIPKFGFYTKLAFFLLLAGGMILGPVVQYYAFGEFWTGVPFGWDLTDNKTLIAFIAWILAFAGNLKKPRPRLTIIAAIVLFLIYLIPHSLFGSELNPESGVVTQGFVRTISLISLIF